MEIPSFLSNLCERDERKGKRESIIPVLQFDTYVSLAEATTGEKITKKNWPIKAIIKNQLFEF
jgi:hypothetical protein